VDDVPMNLRVLEQQLRRLGVVCITQAEDGKQAVDAEAGGAFDIVICDLQMPVMGGTEAAAHIVARYPQPGGNLAACRLLCSSACLYPLLLASSCILLLVHHIATQASRHCATPVCAYPLTCPECTRSPPAVPCSPHCGHHRRCRRSLHPGWLPPCAHQARRHGYGEGSAGGDGIVPL
jgi:CheY-like chemotaxis protein